MTALTAPNPAPNSGNSGWMADGRPDEVLGTDLAAPVVGGRRVRYVYLDNAASTPPLRRVRDAVERFLPWYSSVHRGAGYKSRVATEAYDAARHAVRRFVNADASQSVIFTKNTTEGLNRVAALAGARGATVISSIMEHHANMLPWRLGGASVRLVDADAQGVLDEDALRRALRTAPPGPRLVAVSGAYNVTGYTPPIHRLARMAHEYGAEILVDGAQLVPHRPIDLRGAAPDEQIEYLVFSAHKMYAPFGTGVLVAPNAAFDGVQPGLVGGGIVDLVTTDEVVWAALPDREEAGTPNVVGAVALAAALTRLEELGRVELEAQETVLTTYALNRLAGIPGLRILGPPAGPDRVGVMSFVLDHVPHGLVAAILSYEYGIGVRGGCFCAHPGVLHLLALPACQVEVVRARLRQHDRTDIPGAVRASLGLQNTRTDVDLLVEALGRIASGERAAEYRVDPSTGDYVPEHWNDDVALRVGALLAAA